MALRLFPRGTRRNNAFWLSCRGADRRDRADARSRYGGPRLVAQLRFHATLLICLKLTIIIGPILAKGSVSEEQELTDTDWRTLRDTLRGSIAMFDMLLAECANSSETARVVGDARRRREKVLEKIERRLRR
jgi:hypothetical protein